MKIIIQTPKKSLNKAFLKQRPLRSEIELFKNNLIQLLGNIDVIEREENQKNHISNFLRDTYYKDKNEINTKDNIDLVIHLGKTNKDKVGVIIETKRPSNINEMLSLSKPNCKALQELVLYYLRERIDEKNIDIKYCIATNIYEWYIFEAKYFEKFFYDNKSFVKQYEDWRDGKKVTKDTNLFYNDIAKPIIDSIEDEIYCTYFDIRDYENVLRNADTEDDKNLIALFKILSPFHLLKIPFADDSNKLDEKFYKELLYIIGLEEVKSGSKHIIRRKENGERNSGSLIENAINVLETEYSINKVSDSERFGNTKEERYFNTALELCITWINRILFLKLLEGQLINYHKGNKEYKFLNSKTVNDYDELYRLFHQVLAKQDKDRIDLIRNKYINVPYLNSSLFEISELEDQTIKINSFDNSATLDLINTTILKDVKKKTDKLPTLEYLFKFLNAYDFASEGKEEIKDENKTLINSSVLGKVFEKINGYKDGSIFTPGFITMYMCRQAIRLAVVQKFKDKYNWDIEKFEDLQNFIADRKSSNDILEFNELINSLRICDPAVGSGHYLVSSLNEIIAIKYELGIFADEYGRRLTDYEIEIEQDEFIITDKHGDIFEYKIENGKPSNKESQRLQKTLFHEKQTIIENCLFGVDINQNSVKICRLRLWIELLKNAYYKEETDFRELETLPNIDINIKCGNSLISRFPLDVNLIKFGQKEKSIIGEYRKSVGEYKNEKNRDKKKDLEEIIQRLKNDIRTDINKKDPKLVKLTNLIGELDNIENQTGLFELSKKECREQILKKKKFEAELTKLTKEVEDIKSNAIYRNAFEWRFEFPEVLDENGNFVGFDVVIGNPPYIKEYENKEAFNGLRNLPCYQGKMDIWYLFGDLGLNILKSNSFLCYIATNNWVTNAGASKFRNSIITKSQIISLIDFGAYMIFDNASIQTMIMILKNNILIDSYEFNYKKLNGDNINKNDLQSIIWEKGTESITKLNPIINRINYTNKKLIFNSDINTELLEKIKSKQNFYLRNKPDKKLKLEAELGQGIVAPQDSLNKSSAEKLNNKFDVGVGIFVLSNSELEKLKLSKNELRDIIKPYFTSKQVKKYYGDNNNENWIIYTKSNINKLNKLTNKIPINDYPNIKKHLDNFNSVITSDFRPYGLHRARQQHLFKGEKILTLRKSPLEPTFTYTDFDCYVSQSFNIIKSERINLKYLTGLLNSSLIAFWLRRKGNMQGNNFQLDENNLIEIPIVNPNIKEVEDVSNLVDKILQSKMQRKDTTALEDEIDKKVYKLYDLTEEEIKIIEGNN